MSGSTTRRVARPKRVSREIWLDRAADHILSHGVSSFSMRAFAAGHGVSTQALISHFGTRDNMIREALNHTFRRDLLVLENMLRQMQSIRGFLNDLVRELQRPRFLHMNAMQIELFAAAAVKAREHSDFAMRSTKRVHGIFESQIRREGIAEEDVERVSGVLVAASRGLVLEALGGQSKADLELVAGQVCDWYDLQLRRRV